MSTWRNDLLQLISKKINDEILKAQFDKTYYALVKSVSSTSATITMNENTYTCRIKDGISIAIGDKVLVKAPNNNFSYDFHRSFKLFLILCLNIV